MQNQLYQATLLAARREARKLYPVLRNKFDYLARQRHIKKRVKEYKNDMLSLLIKINFLN